VLDSDRSFSFTSSESKEAFIIIGLIITATDGGKLLGASKIAAFALPFVGNRNGGFLLAGRNSQVALVAVRKPVGAANRVIISGAHHRARIFLSFVIRL